MEKEFVKYEQALALKELGFDEPCFGYYRNYGTNKFYIEFIHRLPERFRSTKAPLYQQAFRWFREKHKLQAEILWRGDMGCFCYKTGKFKPRSYEFSKDDYKTYEEAEQACLDKLIEICKNDNTSN